MFDLEVLKAELIEEEMVDKIIDCNKVLANFGLVLRKEDVLDLITIQQECVYDVGRIEFSNDIVAQIIMMFCDSKFLTKYDFVEQMKQIIEIFYYYREALDEQLSDEEIIQYLYLSFEGPCQGSLAWLGDYQLNQLMEEIAEGNDIFEGVQYGIY